MKGFFEINTPYIKEKYHDRIKNHKYSGIELSIVYNYFYSPLCTFLVEFLPYWLAPNLITLSGKLIIDSLYLLSIYYSGLNFDSPYPSIFLFMNGVGYILYHILDNIDGK